MHIGVREGGSRRGSAVQTAKGRMNVWGNNQRAPLLMVPLTPILQPLFGTQT